MKKIQKFVGWLILSQIIPIVTIVVGITRNSEKTIIHLYLMAVGAEVFIVVIVGLAVLGYILIDMD